MKVFAINHNGVLNDILKEFEVVSKIEDAERVVLWTDVTSFEQGVVNYARSLGIPSIVVQHGRRGSSRYYPPFNEKIQADKLLVWGEADRKALIEAGQDGGRIRVVGSPVFRHLTDRKKHRSTRVVFSPEHWDRPLMENKKTYAELLKLADKYHIITKIIDSPSHDRNEYVSVIESNRADPNHLAICADVLSTADLVVGISESTFELLAQALDIPVVIMEEWEPKPFGGDPRYTTYRRVISNASKKATYNTLCQVIKDQLKKPRELRKERKEVIVSDGGFGLDSLALIRQEIIG